MSTATINGSVTITVAAMTWPHGNWKAFPLEGVNNTIATGTV